MFYRLRLAVTAGLICLTPLAWAVPVQVDYLRGGVGISSVMVDQGTGEIYERRGYQAERQFSVYDDYAAFATGTGASTLTMASDTYYGSYAGVRNGHLFGRTTAQTQYYGRWDLTSATLEAGTNLSGFNPVNGTGTFDYAGYSGLNTLTNKDGMFVIGRQQGGDTWRVESIDESLGHSLVGQISQHPFGFAFLINEFLFLGDTFHEGQISTRFNVKTGVQDAVDFTLTGLGNAGINNTVYDHVSDTLIVADYFGGRFSAVANAAAKFGVPLISVPEPGTVALMVLGLLALWRARRVRVGSAG